MKSVISVPVLAAADPSKYADAADGLQAIADAFDQVATGFAAEVLRPLSAAWSGVSREAVFSAGSLKHRQDIAQKLITYWKSAGYSTDGTSPDGTNTDAETRGNVFNIYTDPKSTTDGIAVITNCFPSDHTYPQTGD